MFYEYYLKIKSSSFIQKIKEKRLALGRYITEKRETFWVYLLNREDFLTSLLLFYFKLVLYARFGTFLLAERIGITYLSASFIILLSILGRFHYTSIGFSVIFFILGIDMYSLPIIAFYKKRPLLLMKHFPEFEDPKRQMQKVASVALETAQNPLALSVIVGSATLVACKLGDIYDHSTQLEAVKIQAAATVEIAKIEAATTMEVAKMEVITSTENAD